MKIKLHVAKLQYLFPGRRASVYSAILPVWVLVVGANAKIANGKVQLPLSMRRFQPIPL